MVIIDKAKKVVTVKGIPVEITNPQWEILEQFSSTEGVTVEKIAQRVYGSQSDRNVTTTSVIISRIKKIVGDPNFIVKFRGKEYVFHETVEVIEATEASAEADQN